MFNMFLKNTYVIRLSTPATISFLFYNQLIVSTLQGTDNKMLKYEEREARFRQMVFGEFIYTQA